MSLYRQICFSFVLHNCLRIDCYECCALEMLSHNTMLLCSETRDCDWCCWTHRWGMWMAKWQGGRRACCKLILVRILKPHHINCKYLFSWQTFLWKPWAIELLIWRLRANGRFYKPIYTHRQICRKKLLWRRSRQIQPAPLIRKESRISGSPSLNMWICLEKCCRWTFTLLLLNVFAKAFAEDMFTSQSDSDSDMF